MFENQALLAAESVPIAVTISLWGLYPCDCRDAFSDNATRKPIALFFCRVRPIYPSVTCPQVQLTHFLFFDHKLKFGEIEHGDHLLTLG